MRQATSAEFVPASQAQLANLTVEHLPAVHLLDHLLEVSTLLSGTQTDKDIMATNQAAWLDGAGSKLRVAEAPMPKAGPGQVVIRNKAVAVNPVDWWEPSHL